MNVMKRKQLRIWHAKRWTESGLPRDPNEWTEQDWRDLNEAMETVKTKVKARHDHERRQNIRDA